MQKRIVLAGGVAGGATCATRLRRMDEHAQILMLERGPYVSFANCGLPYYVGKVIQQESTLLLATPDLFRDRFTIDVRTRHEVLAIDVQAREVTVRDVENGRDYREPFDELVLSPGAAPIRPPVAGVDLPGIFTLRSVPDSREIREWIAVKNARTAVVVGGGFIGLEVAENLMEQGIAVTIVEMAQQVMPPLDPEMAELVRERLVAHGVRVHLGDGLSGFEHSADGTLVVRTQSGAAFAADLAVLAIGVRPEVHLARQAGLAIGDRGGIRVDDQMRTSDAHVWAIGDAVEVKNRVTGQWELVPLAGPANRQARIAADAICGRDVHFHGVQGTAVVGIFGLTAALTGATEKVLRRAGITDVQTISLHPNDHVGYYPGAKTMHLKLVFRGSDGMVLGAQGVGEAGVERRIDVIATAIQLGATVFDLEEAELCYAPQYGAAKDPVNVAGMIAANVQRGDVQLAPWTEVESTDAFLLDVRDPGECAKEPLPGALNIPLNQLRSRVQELPRDREIWVTCAAGQRAYYACRILSQHGLTVRNLSGGYQTYRVARPASGPSLKDAGVPPLLQHA